MLSKFDSVKLTDSRSYKYNESTEISVDLV